MSYSFEGSFRTRESARRTVMKDSGVPDVIRAVLIGALNALSDDTDDRVHLRQSRGASNGRQRQQL